MNVLGISGSSRSGSKTRYLLEYIKEHFPELALSICSDISALPLFHAEIQDAKIDAVLDFRSQVSDADAIIIATPEYIYNIPAALKNALEWCTKTAEFHEKKVMPIVYSPLAPRGAYALKSLEFSLKALNCRNIGSLSLHHTEISFDDDGKVLNADGTSILNEAIDYFVTA